MTRKERRAKRLQRDTARFGRRKLLVEQLESRRLLAAQDIVIPVSLDAEITDLENDGVFDVVDQTGITNSISNYSGGSLNIEQVAILEFDTSVIPAGAQINTATLDINVAAFSLGTPNYTSMCLMATA